MMCIQLRSTDVEAMAEGALIICGICLFWPFAMIYIIVAFSISLAGRAVYGKKHSLGVMLGFIFALSGIILALVGWFLLTVLLTPELGVAFWAGIPFILIVVGLFMYIKDIGGMLWGGIGTAGYGLSKIIFMIVVFIGMNLDDLDQARNVLGAGAFASAIALVSLIVLLVGFINALRWMNEHQPLIDEQEAQQMQMQQQALSMQSQQLAIQQQQLSMQQQQLQLTHQIAQSPMIGANYEPDGYLTNGRGEDPNSPPRSYRGRQRDQHTGYPPPPPPRQRSYYGQPNQYDDREYMDWEN